MESIEQAIRDYLATHTGRDEAQTLSSDQSLLETGIIDSAVMVGLVAFIEERFGFTVDEDDMIPENFETLQAIARYVATRTASTP